MGVDTMRDYKLKLRIDTFPFWFPELTSQFNVFDNTESEPRTQTFPF